MGIYTGADISRAGVVGLTAFAPGGSTVAYYERIGARRALLGRRVVRGSDLGRLERATTWRCDRLVRRFEADAVGTDGVRYAGAYAVRTPSCRYRLAVTVPRRVARGRTVVVGIRDTWRLGGVRPRVCVAPPRSRARCATVRVPAGSARGRHRFRVTRSGEWRVRLRYGPARPLRRLQVGGTRTRERPARKPVVLATGDSTMQGVDGFLADRLGDSARVAARIRPATGVSKPGSPSWLKTARLQSSALRPAATVVSVGVNDGYAMRTPGGDRVACCGPGWVSEYARRARMMMRTWTRFGGHVAWMTLPPPGVAHLAPRLAAVNAALLRAAAGVPRATVVRIDTLLSTTGAHEPFRVVRGRRVRMYLPDALHLSPPGTSLAAGAAIAALRDSGALPRGR